MTEAGKPRGAGVLLAAGRSERMGRPKALLPFRGRTFIAWVAERLVEAGLSPVVAVVASDEVASALAGVEGVRAVRNPEPQRGQLSSLQCAITESDVAAAPYALVALVDHPAVRPETYRALVFVQEEEPAAAHVPLYGARRGHPVAFPRALLETLRGLAPTASAEPAVESFHPLIEVPVDDPGVVADADRPEDLARLGEA